MIYIRKETLCMKSIEQTEKIQEKENRKKQKKKKKRKEKENQTKEKLQKRKGAKKRREGITRRESPRPRPIKESSTKRSKHLITGAIQILKSPSIPFLPNTP